MAAFLMQSRDNPLKALGLAVGIISVMVLVTVMISTVMFFRNTKSNRITPARRIIRRRPKEQRHWTFRSAFGQSDPNAGRFLDDDDDTSGNSSSRPKPPPPSAPVLPPAPPAGSRPSERVRAVPTVSGALASKIPSRSSSCRTSKSTDGHERSGHNKDGSGISSALVSELKMRIEQKIIEANQGYYY